MNKETLDTSKYFISGLYDRPFYDFIYYDIEDLEDDKEYIFYDKELFLQKRKPNLKGTEQEISEIIEQEFWADLNYHYVLFDGVFYEPTKSNYEAALECGLTLFFHRNYSGASRNLLALSGGKVHVPIRLDAYQVLTHRTIDAKSEFFTKQEYYEEILGKELVEKMNKILRNHPLT